MATILQFAIDHLEVTTVLVGITVFVIAWRLLHQPRADLPPGPPTLPIIGSLPFLRGPPEAFMENVCKKYGPVARFSVGSLEFITVGNYEAVKDSFIKQGDTFTGKPKLGLKPPEEETGIGFMEGDSWKAHRRFILSTFRDFGMGKLSLEPRITEEIQTFLDDLAKYDGQPVEWHKLMAISVSNVICAMEFGSRFDYDDPEFVHLRNLLSGTQEVSKSIFLKICFPWMRFIPFFHKLIGFDKLIKGVADLDRFFAKKVEEHRNEYQSGSRRDFIDTFFTEKNMLLEKNGVAEDYEDDVLISTLGLLFVAGSESIVATMKWALAILVTYPEIMKTIQKEIDETIGRERVPSMTDRTKMLYTEAFLNEVHRYGSVAPTIIHCTMEPTTVMGYHVPRRSYVHCDLLSIHFDPHLWDDPKTFRPERFLDENGKLQKPDQFLAFGVGKRNCIGESLARMELFLYFTSLLQRFEPRLPDNDTVSLDKVILGIARSPNVFNLRFIERKEERVTE